MALVQSVRSLSLYVLVFSVLLTAGGSWWSVAASARGDAARTLQERLPEHNLLEWIRGEDLAKIDTTHAHVYQDPGTRALTFTFDYGEGEPEVRIPVRALGWPVDWSAYRSIQYTFHASSLETIAIGFSDGHSTKAFVTEPLAGIRIYGVIPFDAFTQTRTMTPLRPLGYKVWPGGSSRSSRWRRSCSACATRTSPRSSRCTTSRCVPTCRPTTFSTRGR
jgi:hypothetical protein